MKQLNILAFCVMLMNVALNLFLIPRLQATGSALASLVTQLTAGALQAVIAIKVFKLKPNWNFIFRLIGFSIGVLIIGLVSTYFGKWFYGYLVLLVFSVLLAFAIRLLNISDLYKLLVTKS